MTLTMMGIDRAMAPTTDGVARNAFDNKRAKLNIIIYYTHMMGRDGSASNKWKLQNIYTRKI